jgi:hypothetical protein
MKNIHVLLTKPNDETGKGIWIEKTRDWCNIYITNDSEINQQTEPCWCINTIKNTWDADLIYYQGSMPQYHYVGFKKIIITTDQDLIADGVQAIDDEFLEWFVKNPSCEYVEVNDSKVVKEHIFDGSNDGEIVWEKKITIPQKEAKQETLTYTESAKKEERIFNSTMIKQETLEDVNDTIVPIKKVTIDELLKEYGKNLTESEFKILNNKINIKQETLEEAAERILANNIDGLRDALQDDDLFFFYKDVIQCYGEAIVKWQAQRMYSEEDMFTAMGFASAIDNNMDSENKLNLCIDFIKNFKNK